MMHVDLLEGLQLRIRKNDSGKSEIWDSLRKKWLILSPEEHVRQALIQYLTLHCAYPAGLIAVERQICYGSLKKRFDIVVFSPDRKPWMLIECKAPEIPISERTLQQLLQYHKSLPCPFWVLSNGHHNFCADARVLPDISWLETFPDYPRI